MVDLERSISLLKLSHFLSFGPGWFLEMIFGDVLEGGWMLDCDEEIRKEFSHKCIGHSRVEATRP